MKLKIREYREEFQLTQKELAEKIGSAQKNISNWEKGLSEPDCETIMKISTLFHISLDELFGRHEYTKSMYNEIDYCILKELQKLNDVQKKSLLQFLKDLSSNN